MDKQELQVEDRYFGMFHGITIHAYGIDNVHLVELTAPDGTKHIFAA